MMRPLKLRRDLTAVLKDKDEEINRLHKELEVQNVRVAALRENRQEDNQIIISLLNIIDAHVNDPESEALIQQAKEALSK